MGAGYGDEVRASTALGQGNDIGSEGLYSCYISELCLLYFCEHFVILLGSEPCISLVSFM